MPANLKDLRRRIKSVKATQQITRAMKLISTAKFGRAQQVVIAARPFTHAMTEVVGRTLACVDDPLSVPLLNPNDSNVVVLLVVSSERGLCGSYNANVAKAAIRTMQELEGQGKKPVVVCVGKKAYQLLVRFYRSGDRSPGVDVSLDELGAKPDLLTQGLVYIATPLEKPSLAQITLLANTFRKSFENGAIGGVQVIYTRFVSAMSQDVTRIPLLPFVPAELATNATMSGGGSLFEPSLFSVLESLLPRYLIGRMQQIFFDASASEQGARMTAMDSAMRNAKEMLRRLEMTYQRARQAAITNEIIEIVSGADAL